MAITVTAFDKFWEHVGKGEISMSADTFKVMLVNAYTFDATDDVVSDLGAVQVANGNGYTTGGQTLANKSYAYTSGVTKFDADDAFWTASGGNIGPATGAVIYDSTQSNRLVCYIDFGGSETAGDDTDFKITFNSSGIFTIV